MNTPVTFSNEGAHFRIADSELDILNELSAKEYGNTLQELPIGKAATMLRTILLAGGADGRLEKEGKVVVSSDMDGEDATIAAYGKVFDPLIGNAVMNIGRVTVDVIKKNEIDSPEAEPVTSFEILSNAFRWAKSLVESHKNQLIENSEQNPRIPAEALNDMPERGEIALEHQGLWLMPENGSNEKVSLVRIPDHS